MSTDPSSAPVVVDIAAAARAFNRLKGEQIPKFIKAFMNDLAQEARKLLVYYSSPPYIGRISGWLVTSIDIRQVSNGLDIGPIAFYAPWVYGGTSRMAARPAHIWAHGVLIQRAPTMAKQLADEIFTGGP